MQIFSLYVCDMLCVECSQAVKQRLANIPGVYHVNVNLAEGTATIYYKESSTALEEIQQLVDDYRYLGRYQLAPYHECKHTQIIQSKLLRRV